MIANYQLGPPTPPDTPKGPAFAHVFTDYGRDHSVPDVRFVNDTSESWGFSNRAARPQKNVAPGVRRRGGAPGPPTP